MEMILVNILMGSLFMFGYSLGYHVGKKPFIAGKQFKKKPKRPLYMLTRLEESDMEYISEPVLEEHRQPFSGGF